MEERPKKRRGPITWLAGTSRRSWICVALMPMLYVASIGPACWLNCREYPLQVGSSPRVYMVTAPRIYWPIGWAIETGGPAAHAATKWYIGIGVPKQTYITLPTNQWIDLQPGDLCNPNRALHINF